ncbi:hypothetical protein L6452_44143 [Arctium lappa]|uniref:Uncharacterized protein n=1 Tax=Arctium lappa TaxID=4217 RepID=A0ACB8XG15_ARCLA|nr:hypothetical protein L6452_44143 [Arctium lappa]
MAVVSATLKSFTSFVKPSATAASATSAAPDHLSFKNSTTPLPFKKLSTTNASDKCRSFTVKNQITHRNLQDPLYTADLQTRLGITAGISILIRNMPEKKGDRYEAICSFHLGDYGIITVQGAYVTTEDTYLSVTGGTGIFTGAYGQVRLQQLVFPFKVLYTFHLQGLAADLPPELLVPTVPPTPEVEASPAAKACEPGATCANYTN